MRSLSQGGSTLTKPETEYTKRPKCRSVRMQHVLPSRSVCVAYHGMSIPLPATSLRGALSSSMTERRALQPVSNVVQGGPKDSGCQSQLTASEVSYGGSVTTAAEPVGAGSNTGSQCGRGGKRGVSQTEEKCPTSSELDRESSDSEVPPVLKPLTESPTEDSNRRSFIATDVLTGCSLIAVAESTAERVSPRMSLTVSSKDPESKRAWVQAGRGRALQQFVSQLQLSPPVGKSQTQSTSPNSVCGVQPKAEACMNDLHLSPNTPEDSVSLPSLGEASICNENDATINDTSLQDVVLPTETTATVPDEIAISPTQPREDSVPSPSVVRPATTTGSASRKTPKSSRKARVSLAIQFRGTCTPHRSPALVASQKPVPPPPEKTREPKSCLSLRKPSDFGPSTSVDKNTEIGDSCEAAQTNSLDAAHVNTEDDKSATLEQQPGAGDPGERVLQELDDDEDSQEDVLTQVSEMEECDLDLDECCQLSNEGREPSSPAASEGTVSSPLRREVVSSDEEELDSAGARMGRSADDVERSIAVHQRNIHRNLVELKRVQRKNRAMEEAVTAEMADHCQEEGDCFDHPTTPERESGVSRVISLQVQFAANSEDVKRRAAGYKTLLEHGSRVYEHDRLACMELKLEVESLELEDKLLLAKLEAQLLLVKTDLLYE